MTKLNPNRRCPCGSGYAYKNCCEPVINNDTAATADALMRSRFSAFALGEMQYIYLSYSEQARNNISQELLTQDDQQRWLALNIIQSTHNTVEFKAFYAYGNTLNMLHEDSSFVCEKHKWRYDTGHIKYSGVINYPKNANCFCGSGKKYKRCCYHLV